jgi:hypothetical protein
MSMIFNSEVIVAFGLGIVLTMVALIGWVVTKSDPNNNTLAPIRIRVDEKRRGGHPPQREERAELNQSDIFFWLFVAMIITLLVLAFQI